MDYCRHNDVSGPLLLAIPNSRRRRAVADRTNMLHEILKHTMLRMEESLVEIEQSTKALMSAFRVRNQ
jgi:hypothetical protein